MDNKKPPSSPHPLDDVAELTRSLMHSYYAGNFETWFEYMHPQCIWISSGEPILFGAKAIQAHFRNSPPREKPAILREDYYKIPIDATAVQVVGTIAISLHNDQHQAVTLLTMTYRIFSGQTKIISHHFSYDYFQANASSRGDAIPMDINTRQFVRSLLIRQPRLNRIAIHSGPQTIYTDPNAVLYVEKGMGRQSQIVCIDQTISCASPLHEIASWLPGNFYPIHRSYLVNVFYITAMYRYEAELISGIKIPVPARNYMRAKKEIEEIMNVLAKK